VSAPIVSPLIPADWLAARAGDKSILRLDLRLPADGGQAAYEAAHVPGAVFSDYAADGWRARVGNVPGLLPSEAHLSALFSRLGIAPSLHVVIIPAGTSANDLAAAARAYWTLRHAGHAALSILDGGTAGWIAGGHPVETGWNEPEAMPPYPFVWREELRSDAGSVLAAMEAGSATLLDGRSASYFAGAEKAPEAMRAGHIPGAINSDYAALFDPARHGLKPRDALAAQLSSNPAQPVISYCNTGHTAALNWFVLSEVLGRPGVSLYDGSMTDWTQDEARPVAKP
jgi:thiosulfate/3-mercaptopyruvate sulfurtransferase